MTNLGERGLYGLFAIVSFAVALFFAVVPDHVVEAGANVPFVVNSTGDTADSSTADGVCNTGALVGKVAECTLRAGRSRFAARESLGYLVRG